ncbi:DNA topoisomerase IV [Mangrovimonas aestuarii]|uniref:DNA topoisomerase IV n=1 Tax=Mangrovimonas aestuarii TaxID=3018443 RepID=UPI002378DA70|nr:DNA topoisomerase IV [Mangrovimonas aestuarii]
MKSLLTLLLVFLFLGCYNSERNCEDFKTGTFYSEVTIDGTIYKSDFVRTDNIQVETYNKKTDSAQVRWINDCEAIFKTINPKRMTDKKDIHLKILTTTDSSYTFEYSYVGETKKQRGVAFKKK